MKKATAAWVRKAEEDGSEENKGKRRHRKQESEPRQEPGRDAAAKQDDVQRAQTCHVQSCPSAKA